jgi:hypothetical protein
MSKLPLVFVLATACTPVVTTSGSSGTAYSPASPPPAAHDHHNAHQPASPPAHTAPKWDSTGWTLLGSLTVNGRADRDVIKVAKRARWDRLTMVVHDSDLELVDFNVKFANNESWSPKLKHAFREGERARTIDLPGDDRQISEIELVYKNTAGGGNARVEIYAKDVKVASAPPSPPPYTPPSWDSTGWTLLGEQSVDGKKDTDTFIVGKKPGLRRLDKLTVVVKDSDLELLDFVVTFGNNDKWSPKLTHQFRENQRSRTIDLPLGDRWIKDIQVKYANLPGGGRAKMEIWAKDTEAGVPKNERKGNK